VHPGLAASPSLAATDEQRAAAAIEVRLAQRERFVDAQAGAPQHDDKPAKPPTVHTVAGDPHDCDDLLYGGRVGRIAQTFVARGTTGMKAGHRRRRPATTGGIKNGRSRHELQTGIRPQAQSESAGHRATGHWSHLRLPLGPRSESAGRPPPDIVGAPQSHRTEH
jgi:hypothetical protein